MKRLRTIVQFIVLAAVVTVTVRHFLGATQNTIETWCPMGGLATLWSFFGDGLFTCVTGEINVALFAALILSAVVARKAFCGWICPVGALSEWARALSIRLFGRKEPPRGLDRWLRWMRLPVLVLVLVATAWAAELVFRGFCPYYVLFGLSDHGVAGWQYALMGLLVVTVFVVPMAWCRYLCPLGGALWPFARVGSLRITRDDETCTHCDACDKACPQALAITGRPEVPSGDCTLCLDCVEACPAPGTLELAASPVPGRTQRWRTAWWVVPVVLVALTAVGLASASFLEVPSYRQEFSPLGDAGEARTVDMKVRGLRCRGTARSLARQLEPVPGILSFEGFASTHRARLTYNPSRTDVDALVRAMEGMAYDEDSGEFLYGLFKVLSVDDKPRR